MSDKPVTERDRRWAQLCVDCNVCNKARRNQGGLVYKFVKYIEGGICPFCSAYEKVHGRKAHEPIPEDKA